MTQLIARETVKLQPRLNVQGSQSCLVGVSPTLGMNDWGVTAAGDSLQPLKRSRLPFFRLSVDVRACLPLAAHSSAVVLPDD